MVNLKTIPLSKPLISNKEIRRVKRVMKSGLLTQGSEVKIFEQSFSDLHLGRYCVAVNSGTSALHLGILGLSLGSGEILCPAFTFAASANAISLAGAKPVFVDVDPTTFNIDVNKAKKAINVNTRAILVVHLYGLPADMSHIIKLAREYNLKVIEDAAQAHLASIENRPVGTFGDVAAFSFYPTKNMTTGEGGMIVTEHKEIEQFTRKMRNQGMKVRYENDLIGFNLRMTDIHAAIGIEQLRKLPFFTRRRIENAQYFSEHINNRSVTLPIVPFGFKHVFHQYTIKSTNRDRLMQHLSSSRVECGVYYPTPVPKLKSFLSSESFPISAKLAKEVLSIPVHPRLSHRHLKRIVESVNLFGA